MPLSVEASRIRQPSTDSTEMGARPASLFHFSEDPGIERFIPHVPPSNPTQVPAVWAIDANHSPLYWFPRDCPRVTAWPRSAAARPHFEAAFSTTASRIHAIELAWLGRVRDAAVWRYEFDSTPFEPWSEATGQWIPPTDIPPLAVEPVGDLLRCHIDAGIELRAVPSLWPLHDHAQTGDWDFSIVRMANASPRA